MAASNENSFLPYKKGVSFGYARRAGVTSALDNSFRRTLISTGGDYPVKATDTFLAVSVAATVTVTLPAITDIRAGQKILVIVDEGGNADTFPISITSVADSILGVVAGNIVLAERFESVILYSTGKTGGGWFSMSRNGFDYVPSFSASWFGLNPTTIADAVDRLGSAYEEMHGAVPQTSVATTSECLDLTANAAAAQFVLVQDSESIRIPLGPLTLSAWVHRTADTASIMSIIHKGGTSYELRFRATSNLLEFLYAGFQKSSTTAVGVASSATDWTHVVASMTEMGGLGTVSFYINGIFDGSGTATDVAAPSGTTVLQIGSRTGSTALFVGKLDNVSIWNAALTALEVQEIYNDGFPADLSRTTIRNNLQAWYRLGDNNELVANDYSTNLNVGSLEPSGGTPPPFTSSGVRLFNHRSILFNSSGYIAFTGANILTALVKGSMTCSFWMKHAGGFTGSDQAIVNVSDGVAGDNLLITMRDATGVLSIFSAGATSRVAGTAATADALWHHFVVTKDAASIVAIYRDAVVDTGGTDAGQTITPAQSLIGAGGVGPALFLDGGNLDEITFWDKKLSSTEITELYNDGVANDLTGHSAYRNLTNWWRMGDQVFDSTDTVAGTELLNDVRGTKTGTPITGLIAANTELDVPLEVFFSTLFVSASTDNGTVPTAVSSGFSGFSAITASLWVQRTSAAARHVIFDFSISGVLEKFFLEFTSSDEIRVGGRSSAVPLDALQTTTSAASFGATATWFHIVAIINVGANSFSLFVDDATPGTPLITESGKTFAGATFAAAAGTTQAIAMSSAAANHFDGNIDELSLWNKALSPTEVTELFNGGVPLPATGHSAYTANAIHYWRMGDDAIAPTIPDIKGIENITLVGAAFVADTPP